MILDEILKQILVFLIEIIGNYGFSIIALSLVVFIIMLPLFWYAEKLQKKERARKAEMQQLLNEIEGVQNKQEKYYYTREIYKKYGYKAYYSLTGLVGLLIQIPFFLAAYWMLSDFTYFDGKSFGPIGNLYQADGLISIGQLKVNILPFLMTIVNFIAIYFERNRLDYKEIKQLLGTAMLFLIILYDMSAALVLYWTANNFFSIFKNKLIGIDYKSDNPNTQKRDINFALIKEYIFRYEKAITNLVGIFIGYFYFVQITQVFLVRQNASSRVFILLTLIGILCLFFMKSFLTKKIKKRHTFVFTFIAIVSISFFSGFIRNLLGLSFDVIFYINNFIVLSGGLFLIWKLRIKQSFHNEKITYFLPFNFYLLFLSLAIPLTVYLQSNQEYFDIISGVFYYLLLIGVPILIFNIIWVFLKNDINQRILAPSYVATLLTFYFVPIITDYTQLTSASNFTPHVLVLFIMVTTFIIIHNIDTKLIPFLSISIIAILIFQKTYTSENEAFANNYVNSRNKMENEVETFFTDKSMINKPDIYLLIYDSYVEESQLKTLYNIENKDQMNFLKAQNFIFHENIYSTGRASLESMSNVVNISNLFEGDVEFRKRLNGESVLNRILQKNGYVTHNIITPYFTRGSIRKVDYNHPSTDVGMFTIIKAIFIGEFKFDIEYPSYESWIKMKNEVVKTNSKKPLFIYSHSRYPGHSQNSGTLLPNETQLFKERLTIANQEMKNDILQILNKKKESIIIIAGDHGPYLTADGYKMLNYDEEDITSDHILDRYGVFLAIRYPDSWKKSYGNKIEVLQQVFVNVLSNMYELQAPSNIVGKESSDFNERISKPAIINGIIQIGNSKGKPLFK